MESQTQKLVKESNFYSKDIYSFKLFLALIFSRLDCNCLPGCFELSYTKTDTGGILSDKFRLKGNVQGNVSKHYFQRNMALMHFFFIDTYFRKNTKSELFGFTDFLCMTSFFKFILSLRLDFNIYGVNFQIFTKNLTLKIHFVFPASTGGLLGLFLGFSFLSAVEIGYYLSLKIFCKAIRSKKKQVKRKPVLYPFMK